MAIKLWFGKKEPDPVTPPSVACDVTDNPVRGVSGVVSAPVPLQAPSVPQQAGAGAVVPEALIGKGLAPVAGPVPLAPVAVVPREVVPDSGEQKPMLKAVGGPVRLAVRPAGEPGAVTAAPTGTTPVRPSFGLRPKAEVPKAETAVAAVTAVANVATATTAATAAETGVVERNAEATVVRPKVDQRALYYQLMNGLYDAVLVLDDQGHVVDCNNRVAEMLGYSREEAWDMPIGKVITGMVSQMFEHLKRNLAENHHVLIDARCYRKDGTSFAGEVGVSLISLTRGNNMVFAIRSVERRKNAMDDLRKSQAALEIAFAPTFVCDTDGFFVVANQALLDLFGIPDAEQAKGARFMDILPDAARLFLRASCGEKIRETLNVPTPDGLQVKLQLALMPIQSGQNVTGVAGSILQM